MAAQVGEPPTVANDDNLSQPSTSAGVIEEKEDGETEAEQEDMSDSDDDISYEEYCNRKDILLNKIILSERMWNKMMVTYRYTRLKETEKEKEAIANRTDPEYLRREAALEAQAKEEQDKERTIYDVESAALERDHEGEMDLIERGYRDRRQYIFSQLIYERQLIADKLLARIIREDEVRADARIFVGYEIPDEWLDEFVAEYVDALEAEENSEGAVKERNRRRYRKEAGESLDDGRPLSNLLDKAYSNGKWGQRCSIRPLPQVYYDELEQNKIDRQRKEERQKILNMKVENMNIKTFERFFPYKKKTSRPTVSVLSESVRISSEDVQEMFEESKYEEDLEKMEKYRRKMDKVKKMKKETIVKRMRTRKREREILKTTTIEPEIITIKEPEDITLDDTEESVKNKHLRTKKNSVVKNRITKPKTVTVVMKLKRQRTKKEIEELEYCRGFIMECDDEIKKLDTRAAEIIMKETKRFELEEMMEMRKQMRKEVDESPESGSITEGTSTPKSETFESESGIIDPGVNDMADTGIMDTGIIDAEQQSDQYASEEEEEEDVDLETTLREGIKAILTTFGKPIPQDDRNKRRVDRLRESLTNVLNERRQLRVDSELAKVQQKMISSLEEMKMESDNSDVSDLEDHSMQDFTLEQQVREASFVRGLVERSIKRPNMGPWLDIDGRAEGAVERVRQRKEQLQEKLASMKRDRLRKRMMGSDSYEDQEIRYWEMKEEERRRKMEGEAAKRESEEEFSDEEEEEEEHVGVYEENGEKIEEQNLTEEEKAEIAEKERKLRQIRAVIEGRDPNDIEEPIPIVMEDVKEEVKEEMEEKEEKEEEEVPVKQIVYSKKQRRTKRLAYLRNLTGVNGWLKKRRQRSISSEEEEEEEEEQYDSKQRISFGEIPTYRLAEQPKVRFKPQLSQERIIQDLLRSGALRERETYGEHIEKLDNERRQRILETLPSTSSTDLTKLLSPRSRVALDDFPSEAFARLSKEERAAFIEDLPSPSKDSDDSDEDEYARKPWNEEEEEEEEEAKIEDDNVNHEEMMEVDNDRIGEEDDEDEERMEEPRGKEIIEFSPHSAVGVSPLHLEESSIQKKKSIPRMNGFSRTGSTTAF